MKTGSVYRTNEMGKSYLPTFESAVGGDDPPHWIAVGVIAWGDLFSIHLSFYNHFEAYMSDL